MNLGNECFKCAIILPYAGIGELGVRTFRAKIGTNNGPSLQLFQQKMSFVKVEAN